MVINPYGLHIHSKEFRNPMNKKSGFVQSDAFTKTDDHPLDFGAPYFRRCLYQSTGTRRCEGACLPLQKWSLLLCLATDQPGGDRPILRKRGSRGSRWREFGPTHFSVFPPVGAVGWAPFRAALKTSLDIFSQGVATTECTICMQSLGSKRRKTPGA